MVNKEEVIIMYWLRWYELQSMDNDPVVIGCLLRENGLVGSVFFKSINRYYNEKLWR